MDYHYVFAGEFANGDKFKGIWSGISTDVPDLSDQQKTSALEQFTYQCSSAYVIIKKIDGEIITIFPDKIRMARVVGVLPV